MFRPGYTRSDDLSVAQEIIDSHPFATLVSVGADGDPFATHLPILREEGTLVGHVARDNPHAALGGGRALLIFQGPHGYVSPTAYGDPHKHVPTWNYVTVHVYGVATRLPDAESLAALDLLVQRFEAEWTADPTVRASLLPGLVGLRFTMDRVETKLKLSQNRSREDALRVAEHLRRTEPALATWMRRTLG